MSVPSQTVPLWMKALIAIAVVFVTGLAILNKVEPVGAPNHEIAIELWCGLVGAVASGIFLKRRASSSNGRTPGSYQ